MKYNSLVCSINGAKIEIEFYADNNQSAADHIIMVTMDPYSGQWSRTPQRGETWVRFRRHYAEHWIDAGKVDIEYGHPADLPEDERAKQLGFTD